MSAGRCAAVVTLLAALALSGCLMDPRSVADQRAGYDPLADPAVNPDRLFAPFPEAEPERANRDTVLRRYTVDEPTTLNPWFIRAWADAYLFLLLFDPLVHRDRELRATWNENVVAAVEELADGRIHRVRLHPGLRWHDGEPFTSRDVRFSIEAIRDPSVPALDFKYKVGEIEEIRVFDDLTFEVVHVQASALTVDNLLLPILPAHVLDRPAERRADPTLRSSAYYNQYQRELGIGNGPYRFVEWVPGDRVVVERWPEYPSSQPHFERVVLTSQPDRNTALLQFRQGRLDDIWLTVQQFATQTNDEAFRDVGTKVWSPRWMQGYIGWNLDGSNPFFGDVRVRHAMAHAYDRERVLRTVTYNLYSTSTGIFGPSHWCHDASIEPIEYDLERARELLDEAGWRSDPEDGWRYKTIDGERVRFHFVLLLPQSYVDAIRMVEIYRDDLRRIGVSFDSVVLENATLVQAIVEHEYQAHAGTFQVFADPDIWRNSFHGDMIDDGRNFRSYRNPAVDELFDRSRLERDREKRAAMLRQIQRLIFEDQPVLFLFEYSTTWAFSRRLRGVTLSPAGVVSFLPSHRGWWVEEPLRR